VPETLSEAQKTLDEAHSVNKDSAKITSSSVFLCALGETLPSAIPNTRQRTSENTKIACTPNAAGPLPSLSPPHRRHHEGDEAVTTATELRRMEEVALGAPQRLRRYLCRRSSVIVSERERERERELPPLEPHFGRRRTSSCRPPPDHLALAIVGPPHADRRLISSRWTPPDLLIDRHLLSPCCRSMPQA
jgi:hypothetical protein